MFDICLICHIDQNAHANVIIFRSELDSLLVVVVALRALALVTGQIASALLARRKHAAGSARQILAFHWSRRVVVFAKKFAIHFPSIV